MKKGSRCSEKTRRKMSESQKHRLIDKRNHPMFGKKHSPETKLKMAEAKKGYKGKVHHNYGRRHSLETREKVSEAMKGNKHLLGYRHSEETRMKLSVISSGKENPMYGIKGKKAPGWKGGEFLMNGYWFVYQPDHPAAIRRGVAHIKRCQLVLEKQLKRYLTENEEVHHKNKVATDDNPGNLEAKSKSKHQQIHALERIGYAKRDSLGRFMKGGDAL